MSSLEHNKLDSEDISWRWCLVGNVVQSHEFGEEHCILNGTKQFAPGAKVYIAPAQWGDGYEKVCVIGKPRRRRCLIEVVMKMDHIKNLRLKKVFKPDVLDRMATSPYQWWGSTDADRDRITCLLQELSAN